MTHKERINELHRGLEEGTGAIVPLSPEMSPPEFLVLCGEGMLEGKGLPSKKQIGTYTWENRKRRAFLRSNAVLWAVRTPDSYTVGVGASVDVRTAARAARLYPDRVVRLG